MIGRRQVHALAEWYGRPDRVVSSPLGRALETARALADEPEMIDRTGRARFRRVGRAHR